MSVRFSVNIPVYNTSKYIPKCLDSILNQTFTDFEIIIVNDGSTDNSEQVCKSYTDPRIRYYYKDNEGPVLTRRYSIDRAEGEYCLFIDSDDFVEPDYLETVDRIIREENCDIVNCSFKMVYSDRYENAIMPWYEKKVFCGDTMKDFRKMFFTNNGLNSICTKIFKTELIKSDKTDFRKFSDIRSGEDIIQTFYPVFNCEKIVYCPECFYCYRQNEASITQIARTDRYKDVFRVRGEIYDRLNRDGLFLDEYKTGFSNLVIKALTQCIKEIARSDIDIRKKAEIYEDIAGSDFYEKMIENFDASSLDIKNRLVYKLFSGKKYKTLVALISGLS